MSDTQVGTSNKWLVLTGMIFVVAMMSIDMTIVAIAAPAIERGLGLSDEGIQWVVNGYLLALAAVFLLGGRLADNYGHKRMVIVGTVIFTVASILCAVTPEGGMAAAWIITARVLQGVGAALMFPAALGIVIASFQANERGRALALFFGISGLLTAVGPAVGGQLVALDWRWVFWINVPVAVIALVLTFMSKPPLKPKREPVDWTSAVIGGLGMALSVYGFQQAGEWGWFDIRTIGCIVVGLVAIGLFAKRQQTVQYPLTRLDMFSGRAFQIDSIMLFLVAMVFIPVFFFASLYAQISLGYSASQAGLFLLYFFLGFGVASQMGGKQLDERGARIPMVLGSIVGAIGFYQWANAVRDMQQGTWWLIMAGAGVGLVLVPANTDAVNRAVGTLYGEVTGITQTIRNYSSALGMAALGTVMLNSVHGKLTNTLVGMGVPSDQAGDAATALANSSYGGGGALENIPASDQAALMKAVQSDFANGLHTVFLVMAVLMVLCFFFALLHPGDRVETPDEEPVEAAA